MITARGIYPPGFEDRTVRYPITFISRSKVEVLIREHYDVLWCVDEGPWEAGTTLHRSVGYFCRLRNC